MEDLLYTNKFLDKFLSDFTSRIVSESGIPSDRYHLGKIVLQGIKDDPDFVMQIDGGTGKSETNGSVLRRSVQCTTAFKNMGLKTGDVMVLMAPNHLDQAIPLYAALYLGITIHAVDRTLGVDELKHTFNIDKPKIIFCQSEKVREVQKAVNLLALDSKIVSFDTSEALSFLEMMEKHGDNGEVQDFKAADFDPDETIAFLISTSGTTGLPKAATVTHKNFATCAPYICDFTTKYPSPTRASLLVAPLQWLSALLNYVLSTFLKFTRIQSSMPHTAEHILQLINKYEPTFLIISPPMMTLLLRSAEEMKCDFSSLQFLYLGGSPAPIVLIESLKRLTPKTTITDTYGMSEVACITFHSVGAPLGSCGKPYRHIQYKLVNIETGEDIKEPNKPGELWLKTPGGFKGYYNNREETAATLKDGWVMSGDILYRDENWNFYFVERIKLLMKYKNHQISPVELETVIRRNPDVLDAAVTSIPDQECGDLPVACVVPRPGAGLTAQEIKDLVKEKLTDTKQLRGGVIFMKELPLTTSTKIHRRKLKEMVLSYTRE